MRVSQMRSMFLLLIFIMVTTSPVVADDAALSQRQTGVADRYQQLEELLLRLADVESAENPERSALLRRAARQSRDKFVLEKLRGASESLRTQEFQKAVTNQALASQELESLLKLLLSEDRSKRIRDEKQRIAKLIKELKRNLNSQRGTRARTENGADLDDVEQEQKAVADRSQELKDRLSDENESEDASENKDSKASDGESKDSESKEGNSEQPPDGEKKEQKAGDKEGDKEKSDKEKSDKEQSDKEQGDSKEQKDPKEKSPSEQKDGSSEQSPSKQNSPSEQSPSQQQPSQQGDPQESQQSQKSQQNQSQQNQQQSDQQQSDQQAQPQTPEQEVEQQLQKAIEKMREAEQELKKAKREPATEKQRQAEENLRAAIDRLERILRQLREEEMKRELAKLESRLRKMAAMQTKVLDDTVALAATPAGQRSRQTDLKAGDLAFEEKKITLEADRAMLLLREEGSSVAFPEVVSQIRSDTFRVADLLGQTKIDAISQGIQQDILAALEEMIAALQKAQRDLEKKKQQQQQGKPGQSPQGEQPLVEALAELKLIRTMETRIKSTTDRYSGLLESGEPIANDVLPLLQDLSERQNRLYRITRDLVLERNQ